MRFGEEEQTKETAESTDEPEVTGRTTEVRTGRGSAGLVRGGDERRWTDETSRKGKGKGNGGKGDHEGKGGGVGRKGTQQETREFGEKQAMKFENEAKGEALEGEQRRSEVKGDKRRRRKERDQRDEMMG